MKTLMLLSLSLAVTLGTPVLPSGVEQLPADGEQHQSPLLGDRVPVQGHVVVENPAPQVILDSPKQQGKFSPMDLKPKESIAENEIKEKPIVKEEATVRVEDKEAEQEAEQQPEEAEAEIMPEMAEELQAEPDFKVEPEVKVEPEFQIDPEENAELQKDQDKSQIDRELDEAVIEERHIDMEKRPEPQSEPMMELETLDDDDMFEKKEHHRELSVEEMSLTKEDVVAELLPEEEEEEKEDEVEEEDEEELLRKNDILDDQPVMELEPETVEEHLQNTADMSDAAVLDEETSPEMMELQMMPQSENSLPDEEAEMEMFALDHPVQPAMEDENLQFDVDQQDLMKEDTHRQQRRSCPSLSEDGKCYLFFQKAKNYGDAELFCQEQFPGGHLASITSQRIHRMLMNLILRQNGDYTRTWVGGRRLDNQRFIWLDGSRWSYEDWLSGEPNNTSGVEDCVEVLAWGNGKFNDFTCWEPQAFICSYPI